MPRKHCAADSESAGRRRHGSLHLPPAGEALQRQALLHLRHPLPHRCRAVGDHLGIDAAVRVPEGPHQRVGKVQIADAGMRQVPSKAGISAISPYYARMSISRSKGAAFNRDVAAYTLAEAARYVRLPVATLRSWVLGRHYPTAGGSGEFSPLIQPASRKPPSLSFSNLIEAHVLRSLRTEHGVPVKALRSALSYAEKTLGIDRLLLRPELRADAGKVFLDRYGELIDLTASGQLAMRRLLAEHLKRVEWDSSRFPVRLYPFLSLAAPSEARPIVIDPRIAFGRPVVLRKGISTSVIAERVDSGESVDDVAADYGLGPSEVEEAIVYERAA